MNITAQGDNFFYGTAGPGTTVVSASSATVKRIVWGGTYVGTTAIHNSATAAGTSATSNIITVGLPAIRFPDSIELNVHCPKGIVVEETGTPTLRVIWSPE